MLTTNSRRGRQVTAAAVLGGEVVAVVVRSVATVVWSIDDVAVAAASGTTKDTLPLAPDAAVVAACTALNI